MKHFYTSQTNSDVCVMPPLVINNFPTFFPAFHSLQSNSPISDHQRQYWLKLINVPRRVTRFRGKAQLIQCISASIFTCSEVQTFIHPDPYSLVATAELLQTCTLIHSQLRPSCQIRSLTLTRIHLAVGTFCTILFQSLTLQRGVTSTARHSVKITCRGVTSPARHAARSHSFVYISTS